MVGRERPPRRSFSPARPRDGRRWGRAPRELLGGRRIVRGDFRTGAGERRAGSGSPRPLLAGHQGDSFGVFKWRARDGHSGKFSTITLKGGAPEQKGVHGSMERDEAVPGRPSGPHSDEHEKRTTNTREEDDEHFRGPLCPAPGDATISSWDKITHSTGGRVSSIQKLCTEPEARGADRRREPRAEGAHFCPARLTLAGRAVHWKRKVRWAPAARRPGRPPHLPRRRMTRKAPPGARRTRREVDDGMREGGRAGDGARRTAGAREKPCEVEGRRRWAILGGNVQAAPRREGAGGGAGRAGGGATHQREGRGISRSPQGAGGHGRQSWTAGREEERTASTACPHEKWPFTSSRRRCT
ncbi:hypothetical protein THAOC_37780 [Thalassiosira oceanica]|uniref:Uncharacterized protein n=1 Tax=Thalassiosira oceanica TaxID=159749 RepID=K0QZM5_THAOC|nr:hypothetical protein THAOC_37780 [Thalassiosira oceanica]|eukprot:EJK43744.1 hypothetical protein THAOC_37780 [Thalassiosira oceanica]